MDHEFHTEVALFTEMPIQTKTCRLVAIQTKRRAGCNPPDRGSRSSDHISSDLTGLESTIEHKKSIYEAKIFKSWSHLKRKLIVFSSNPLSGGLETSVAAWQQLMGISTIPPEVEQNVFHFLSLVGQVYPPCSFTSNVRCGRIQGYTGYVRSLPIQSPQSSLQALKKTPTPSSPRRLQHRSG